MTNCQPLFNLQSSILQLYFMFFPDNCFVRIFHKKYLPNWMRGKCKATTKRSKPEPAPLLFPFLLAEFPV